MSQNNIGGEQRKPWLAPILVSFLLLLLIAGAIYSLHRGQDGAEPQSAVRLAQLQQHIQGLESEKQRLEALLELSPCQAQEEIQKSMTLSPVALVPPASVTSDVQADIVSLLERACVFIVSVDAAGNLSTGSGFFIAPDHIITNEHVVTDKKHRLFITSKALGRPVLGTLVAFDTTGGRDYALVRISTPQGAPIAIPDFASKVRRTEKVGAWGFPHIIGQNDPAYEKLLSGSDISSVPELTYTEGVVSAVLQRKPPLLVHTAPISPGNSGGPLVNGKGQIVGINTMITLDEDSYRQASIAIDAHDLRRFLAAQGIHVTFSEGL